MLINDLTIIQAQVRVVKAEARFKLKQFFEVDEVRDRKIKTYGLGIEGTISKWVRNILQFKP